MERQITTGPILVVEDDRNIQALVVRYLENAGFSTVTADDGAGGLEMARRRAPAFVILDLTEGEEIRFWFELPV